MRTETVTYTVYKFDELSEGVQKDVLGKLWYINIFEDWDECTLEEAKDTLNELGFEQAKIQYTGFCSQGDGASFDAKCNIEKLIKTIGDKRFNRLAKLYQANLFSLEIEGRNSCHNYYHERTRQISMDVNFDCQRHTNLFALCHLFTEYVEELRLTRCQEIYARLEAEHDYLTSDEAIKEAIGANEYEFKKNGELV